MIPVTQEETDRYFMSLALAEAEEARRQGEIPIGAVVVVGGRVIGRGHNMTERLRDVTAHAEMLAITAAAQHLDGKYLTQCTLYVTVEPCLMCAGALAWSQIGRIVYGTGDSKRGVSTYFPPVQPSEADYIARRPNPTKLQPTPPFHRRTKLTRGVLAQECAALMKAFFSHKR